MRWLTLILISFLAVLVTPLQTVRAQLQPHNFADFCGECHSPHGATGVNLTEWATNTALCMSCHDAAGPHPDVLPNKQLADADQALPDPGLPAGVNASGTSHRWDSGASGWVEADDQNTSDGTVSSGGAFTGVYAKTYTITIANAGTVGVATFNWTDTRGCANASVVTTGANVNLNDTNAADDPSEGCGDQGVTVTFTNGTSTNFVAGDIWRVYVRTDIAAVPASPALAARLDNGKIKCTTCHNQHSQGAEPFGGKVCEGGTNNGLACTDSSQCPGFRDPPSNTLAAYCSARFQRLSNDTNQMCLDCHSARNKGSLSGQTGNLTHPVGVTIPGTGNFQSPAARLISGATNNGSGEIRITANAHGFETNDTVTILGVTGTTEANGSWVITVIDANTFDLNGSAFANSYTSGGTARTVFLDSASQVVCMSCHTVHYSGLNDGTLRRMNNITSLCTDCHTLADPGTASHLNTSTGVLWPGGQYGSTFPEITDASKRGACINCHNPHGWPDSVAPSQDYSMLLVNGEENLCYTCHDGNPVTTTTNVYAQFTGGICQNGTNSGELCTVDTDCPDVFAGACSVTNFQIPRTPTGGINQRHDVSDADQTFSGNALECANCHNPHTLTNSNKLINPDGWSDGTTTFIAGQPFTKVYSPTNQYAGTSYSNTDGTDQDPVNPEAVGGWTIGQAVKQTSLGGDTATSGGTYDPTGVESETTVVYTIDVDTPNTTFSCARSPSGSCDQAQFNVVFGTPILLDRGVTITFTDDNRGDAVCVTGGGCDDSATSGGTYGGAADGSYTVTVTTGGRARDAVVDCTGLDCGASPGTNVCGGAAPALQCAYGTAFAVGSFGVTITISDTGARDFTAGDSWDIAVTAGVGLQSGEQWTITVTGPSASFSEPDYVAFCLTCHDNSQPAGVILTGLTVIGDEYFSTDVMGARPGGTGTSIGNGYLKEPWHVQPASCSTAGGWTGCEDPTEAYAALNCTVCHDQHGSPSIFHLKSRITVGGVELTVGGDNPNSQFGPGSFPRWGSATYSLPCQGGNGNANCADNPSGAQEDLHYGAWCTFCHEMSSHPGKTETGSSGSCAGTHSHGGGNF